MDQRDQIIETNLVVVEQRLPKSVGHALDPADRELALCERAIEQEGVGLMGRGVMADQEVRQEHGRRERYDAQQHRYIGGVRSDPYHGLRCEDPAVPNTLEPCAVQ